MKTFYTSIEKVPAAIVEAYDAGRYVMRAPDVCSQGWSKLNWINWVEFSPEIERLRAKGPVLLNINANTAGA